MADKLFKFTAKTVTSKRLDLEIKNTSGIALTKVLFINMKFPIGLVDASLRERVKQAKQSSTPPNMKNVGDLGSIDGGLSVWVFNEYANDTVTLRVVNSLKPEGKALDNPVKVDPDAVIKLSIPLSEEGSKTKATVSCLYRYFGQQGDPISDSFEFAPAGADAWKEEVSLRIDGENPTMLEPGSPVTIRWSIKDGISATLRGPLPGNVPFISLTKERSAYMIEKGWIQIFATGQATYILEADVLNDKREKVQVVRTLIIDTKSAKAFSYLRVLPDRTLPYGEVEIHWAVWGAITAKLEIADRHSLNLTLTEQDLSGTYQGSGIWRGKAVAVAEDVTLTINKLEATRKVISIRNWLPPETPFYRGQPIGLAVAAPSMALLTTEGIWMANVGVKDQGDSYPVFEKKVSIDASKSPVAISAFGKGFVALFSTKDRLQLARYKSDGNLDGTPLDLEDRLGLLRRTGSFSHSVVFDLVALGERVYVVIELRMLGGSYRTAYSVRFTPREQIQSESLIEQLHDYRLLSFGGALFGLHRASGRMVRFDIPSEGEIEAEHVRKAASAVSGTQFLARTGLLATTDDVLVVMSPDEVRMPKAAAAVLFMINVVDFKFVTEALKRDTKTHPPDFVYNPQKDTWTSCGRGLEVHSDAVAAFRGGQSERMWVLQPSGEMRTLTGASATLFTPDYIDGLPLPPLLPALNAKQSLRITNESKFHMESANNVHILSGISSVSSTALVEVEPPPHTFKLAYRNTEIFEIAYHKGDPAPVSLRFLIQGSGSANSPYYFLEVTMSGDDLLSVTSVFKRLMIDGANKISIDEVVDTRVQYPLKRPMEARALRDWRRQKENQGKPDPEGPIVVQPPKRLSEKVKLVICNASPYDFIRSDGRSSMGGITEMTVDYLTPSFRLSAYPGQNYHKFGEFRFDINFALPHGIEACSGSLTQQHLLRIDSDNVRGFFVERATMLKPGDQPITLRHNAGERTITADKEIVYVCRIVYREQFDLDDICIGKGIGAFLGVGRGHHLFLPVARRENVLQSQVLKVDANTLAVTRSDAFAGGGVFAHPNRIARSGEKLLALFNGSNVQVLDDSLKSKSQKNLGDYTAILDLAISSHDDIYALAMKKEQGTQVKYHYALVIGHTQAGQTPFEISLDSVRGLRDQNRVPGAPTWVSPSTISPIATSLLNEVSGRKVAVCIEGGVMVISTRSENVEVAGFDLAGREEDLVFDPGGEWLYCLHSASNNQGLTLTRAKAGSLKEKKTVLLPSGEPIGALISETTSGIPGVPPRQVRAANIIFCQSPDSLFVSQGKTIMRIDPESLAVRETLTVDLPCQVLYAARGTDYSGLMVYALGASYKGDGKTPGEFTTRLYKLSMLSEF